MGCGVSMRSEASPMSAKPAGPDEAGFGEASMWASANWWTRPATTSACRCASCSTWERPKACRPGAVPLKDSFVLILALLEAGKPSGTLPRDLQAVTFESYIAQPFTGPSCVESAFFNRLPGRRWIPATENTVARVGRGPETEIVLSQEYAIVPGTGGNLMTSLLHEVVLLVSAEGDGAC